jgi:hypothetical protein
MYYTTKIDTDHSVPFNYHVATTSEPLINLARDVWAGFSDEERSAVDGKSNNTSGVTGLVYVQTLLVQLYYHWSVDPRLCVATPKNNNAVLVNDFYNTNKVSIRKQTKVLHLLEKHELIDTTKGFHQRSKSPQKTSSIVSRMRAAKRLNDLFIKLEVEDFDIDLHSGRRLIEMTDFEVDENGEPIKTNGSKVKLNKPYDETQPHVAEKIRLLAAYNSLLKRTHVDLANTNEPYIIRKKYNKKKETDEEQRIPINQVNKFTKRVFSRGSWNHHGRFYSGWWQSVGSAYRKHIRINGNATFELDYSSLHPNILLVEEGLEPKDDAYALTGPRLFEQYDQKEQRKLVKRAVMMLFNAKEITAGHKAFTRSYSSKRKGDPRATITLKQFEQLKDAFVQENPALEKYLAADQGIRLMNVDSQIMEQLINNFTSQAIPILCVHDSIVLEEKYALLAQTELKRATYRVLGTAIPNDQNRMTNDTIQGTYQFNDVPYTLTTMNEHEAAYPNEETSRHKQNLEAFKAWKLKEGYED